jgi:molybdopterin/thiamine biosynthesis adenylyltransferase
MGRPHEHSSLGAVVVAELREFSVALTEELARDLLDHLSKGSRQEDLTFAIWRESTGVRRTTSIIQRLVLPLDGERELHGNASFAPDYVLRALNELAPGEGLALIHSHLTPGWQGMSQDDIVAERDRLASAVYGRTGLPVVGVTTGTDGALSARRWLRQKQSSWEIHEATSARVVGRRLRSTFHPELSPRQSRGNAQVATVSVWGDEHQADLARIRVGIVGLGSVGSLVAESLARVGVCNFVLIDYDLVEERNLDRTAGAERRDIGRAKVAVAADHIRRVGTGREIDVQAVCYSVLSRPGYGAALDCDVLFSCVDRPLPRHLLNALAYAHLVPVIDGGILAEVIEAKLIHADWRIHTIGPSRACLMCLGALDAGDVAMDQAGMLDDPDYIKKLDASRQRSVSRRNVFPFSMSVAAHEVLQMVTLITGLERVGGIGPQFYHCYPGVMDVLPTVMCEEGCENGSMVATAVDLSGNLVHGKDWTSD